jgi:RNA polymerase sigma-70 factor, ECF subfamily
MSTGTNVSDESLGRFREYLRRLAKDELGCQYTSKLDPSDLVQQTLLDAHQKLEQFRGTSDRERAAWLREIFANNLADVFRALNRQKRDVSRERSSARLESWLEGLPSRSAHEAEENEQLLRLAWALSELPDEQHAAVELHHLLGLSLAETSRKLGRTEASVAGLVRRGLARLRELMDVPPA